MFNGPMYVHPGSCAARRWLLFVETESCLLSQAGGSVCLEVGGLAGVGTVKIHMGFEY